MSGERIEHSGPRPQKARLLGIAFAVGAAGCSSSGSRSASANVSSAYAPAFAAADADAGPYVAVPIGPSPVRGPADAWVTMIEFADFECPYCGEEEPIIEELVAANPSDLRVVFKNFPLTKVHPDAMAAAIAAECASYQGAFWPMHDRLFQNQRALDAVSLASYAMQSGVDLGEWQTCLGTILPANAIAADVTLAGKIGVAATPTFVINGQIVVGAVEQVILQATIDAKRQVAEASGVPRQSYYQTVILGGS